MALNLAGLKIGHAMDSEYRTGCTVFLCPDGTTGSVDARGPAVGSRELALLQADRPEKFINAICLSGGSAYGLGTADGVMRYLGERDIGHYTPIRPIPIVPAAIVYDLFLSEGNWPTAELGYTACENASDTAVLQGNVGAGAGVTVGKWAGPWHMMKGGVGLETAVIGDLVVGAAAIVNAIGDVVNPDGTMLAGAQKDGTWLVSENPYRYYPQSPPPSLTNTTLVVVFTNATLARPAANRLAQRAHDGMAIAIRPVHTTHDGDTAFSLATNQIEANFDLVANVAVDVVAEAIRNAVRHAETVGDVIGLAG